MDKQQFRRMKDIRWKTASGIKLTKREREFYNAHKDEYLVSDYRYSELDRLQMVDFDVLRAMFRVPEYIGMKEFMYEFNQRLLRRKNEQRLMKKDLKIAPVHISHDNKFMAEVYYNKLAAEIIDDIKYRLKHGK